MLGDKLDWLNALWREKQLQYTWLRGLQGRHADFWQVTSDALDFALETLGIDDAGLRRRLIELCLALDAFAEVPDMAAATTSPLRREERVSAFDIDHMAMGDFQETHRRNPGDRRFDPSFMGISLTVQPRTSS